MVDSRWGFLQWFYLDGVMGPLWLAENKWVPGLTGIKTPYNGRYFTLLATGCSPCTSQLKLTDFDQTLGDENHLTITGSIPTSPTGHRLKAALGKAGDGGFGTSHLSSRDRKASWNNMGQKTNQFHGLLPSLNKNGWLVDPISVIKNP